MPRGYSKGLMATEERKKSHKAAKIRHREAQERLFPKKEYKEAAISDYFNDRGKNERNIDKSIRKEAIQEGHCKYCEALERAGLINCLYCGQVFHPKI